MNNSIFKKNYKSPVSVIYTIVFLGLLICGLWAGFSIATSQLQSGKILDYSTNNINSPIETGQNNLLLIGIDQLSSPLPNLESVWLAIYFPGNHNVTLIPIYPGMKQNAPFADDNLANSFGLDVHGELSTIFVDELRKSIWWDNYLILDEYAFAEVVNFLGSTSSGASKTNRANVLEHIPEVILDVPGALWGQARIVESICKQISVDSIQEGSEKELIRLTEHFRTDLDINTIFEDWKFQRSNSNGSLVCEFPTLETYGP
jgi:hypothetical protein